MSFTCGALIGYDKKRETNLLPDNGCNLVKERVHIANAVLQFCYMVMITTETDIKICLCC